MSERSVLYDVPGPKARRRARIGAGIVLALGVALLVLVLRGLQDRGQLDAELWSPLFNPGDENFSNVWSLLREGMVATLVAAALAIVFSLAIGTLLGTARMLLGTVPGPARHLRIPIIALIELFRGLPVVIAIYFAYRVFPAIGLRLDFLPGEELMWFVIIGLTVYNSVIFAEILRAGVASLPRGQAEAARAVGMSESLTMRIVLLPQAFRIMLPALISQLVVVLKDTTLGSFIGYLELLRRGLRISQNLDNPIQVLLLIAILFITLNYLLSRFATWVQRRLSRASSSRGGDTAGTPEVQAVGTLT